jgi:glycosyltransferase involved in cell wall biosynthesis
MARILIVAGTPGWSMDRVCRGVKAHSKHDIELTYYWIGGYTPSEWDVIYIHCGAVMSGEKKQYVLDHRDETKWAVGIRGPTAYKRNVRRLNSKLWDAFSCGSIVWMDRVDKGSKELDVEGYVCHGGIDVNMFNVQPLPDEFVIGWAGNAGNGAKRFKRFYELPFNKRAVGGGAFNHFKKMNIETDIMFIPTVKYQFMNNFYASCSLYVNTSYKEGGPLPPKEAAACGRPVVCTRVGDAPEWIPEEYMVETKSREYERDKMIEIINRFKDDKDLLIEEGKRFKELSKRWDFSVVVKEYDKMFDGVLG